MHVNVRETGRGNQEWVNVRETGRGIQEWGKR